MRALIVIMLVIFISACTTTQQTYEDRLRSFIGLTVAQFMLETGLFPSDYYESEYGRVFIVHGQRTFAAIPYTGSGYIGSESQCVLQLTTEQVGTSATPESWRIRQVDANGPCGNV